MLEPSAVVGERPGAAGRTRAWRARFLVFLQALLLSAPLALLAAWIARGGLARTHTPGPPASVQSLSPAAPPIGLPPPLADLPASRLEERVNGAAESLRREGCRRLLAWRLENPPADLEVLLFDRPEGARAVLARDAGPARTAGPGEEAVVSAQAILFRRGAAYARILADPSVAIRSGALEPVGERVDRALRSLAETQR